MLGKRVLVTGASGFIGTNLVNGLLENGHSVIGLSRSYPLRKLGLDQFDSASFIPIEGDIVDMTTVANVFRRHKPQIVIHLAARSIVGDGVQSPNKTFEVNARGTWNVLELCRQSNSIERIVVASSDKAYGTHQELPYKENFELKGVSPYDVSKKMTELIAQSYVHTYQLPIVITRCANVFGPFDLNRSRIVPAAALAALNNVPLELRGDGTQKRGYIYVKDVVEAYLTLISFPIEKIRGQAYNIGMPGSQSVLDMVNLVYQKLNIPIDERNIKIGHASEYEIDHQELNVDKADVELNWKTIYSLSKALEETMAWYTEVYDKLPLADE